MNLFLTEELWYQLHQKAFFEGELKPGMPSMDTGDCMDEQIIVKNDKGKLVEMTRRDAAALFKVQSTTTQKSTSKSKIPTQPKKSAIREGKIRRASQEQQSSTQNNIVLPPNTANDSSVFPLMEIRETCDETGNIINSEVVNMSNTMKRLEDNIDAGDTNNNEKDGKQFGELLAKTLKEGEEDITTFYDGDEGFVHVEAAATSTTTASSAIPKERISDKEYKSIYSRLEELERLEEEDMKTKAENAKSSKRLQSSGWSKGFLNKTKKSRGKSPATQKREESSELKVSFTGSSEIKDLASQIESEKTVGFSSVSFDAEHKEIPVESEKLVSFSSARSIDSSVSFCANEDSEIQVDVPSVGSSEKAVSFSAVSFDAEHLEIKDLPSPVESEKLVSFSSAKSIDSSVSFCANEDSEIDSLRKPYQLDSDKELRVSFSSVSFNAADIEIDSARPPSSASSFVSGVTEYDLDIDDDDEEDDVDNPPQDYVPSVSFAENKNEVLEIPRIGQTKVPPRPAPGRPVSFTQDVSDEYIPVSTVPFEDNIFKGVVKERTDGGQVVKEDAQAPKKKLSRFAQQRLERG